MKRRTKIGIFSILLSLCALLYIDITTNMISERWHIIFEKKEAEKEKNNEFWKQPTSAPVVLLQESSTSEIMLPMNNFIRNHVVLFSYPTSLKSIRFFVIKEGIRESVKYRAVADACELCFSKKQGFDYRDRYFICRDCSMSYHSERVGIASGGCNPIPLSIEYRDGRIVISKESLAKVAQMF